MGFISVVCVDYVICYRFSVAHVRDPGCLDYEWKYELFTRNEIGAGAKYFQDSTHLSLDQQH